MLLHAVYEFRFFVRRARLGYHVVESGSLDASPGSQTIEYSTQILKKLSNFMVGQVRVGARLDR